MASTLPPDPYKALGVSKDADATTIKSTYRKLVLKCHPDKVTDESLKKQKQEEFHKIQQAYELIGDEEKRATYDAEVKLEQLRRDKLARSSGAPHVEVKTARYDVRTAAPGQASFSASGPHRYATEERKPASRSYDDDRYYKERSQKYDTYEAYPKHSSASRSSRKEEPIRVSRVSADRTRSDHKKTRDREERRERSGKFVSVESDSEADEKARYEQDYRRRSDEARRRQEEDVLRRQLEADRKKADDLRRAEERRADERRAAEDRRSYEDARYDRHDRQRKLSDLENDAVRYIHRSKVEGDTRPSPNRTSSSRDVRPEHYDSRSSRKESRPEAVRRSAARPKDRPSSSGRERDRKGFPEIVDWEDDRKPPPSFKHSSSSPADLHVPRMPQRSFTESSRDHRRTETSPTPVFRRSETMPSVPHASSSRRTEAKPTRPSGLRSSETVTPMSHGSSRDASPETAYPTVPPPQSSSTKKYYYPTPGGGVSLRPEDVGVANGHRTVLREPDNRNRHRSPSPLSRPPMGANRPVETSTPQYTTATPKVSVQPPTLSRSATFNEERGRSSRPLYGELHSDYQRRENTRRQTSFSPDQVSYSQRIGPDDIRWAPRGREPEREFVSKPSLNRTATYAY